MNFDIKRMKITPARQLLISMVLGALTLVIPLNVEALNNAPVSKIATAQTASTDASLVSFLKTFSQAASTGDGKTLSECFADDGLYISINGAETKGRQLLKDRFDALFKGQANGRIELNPNTIKLLGANIAMIEGTTMIQGDASARFMMVLQKSSGNWLISSATETPIITDTAEEKLDSLNWLIGKWTAGRDSAKVTMSAEWVGNKNFIACKYTYDEPGDKQKVNMQIIGWDPLKEQIISWDFDSTGGFGSGRWNRKSNTWLIHAQGITPAGATTDATNIMSPIEDNKFSWQSINRSIDGTAVPDTEPLYVQRATN